MSSHHIDQKPRSWRALLTRRSYRRPSFREDHDDTLPNACASPRPNSSSSSPTRHPTANYSCSQNKRPDFRFQKAKYLAMCIRCPQQWFRPNDGNRNCAYVTHWTNSLKTKLTMRPDAPANMCSRSEEQTSELQSLMRISYDVFCLNKKNDKTQH